MKNTIPLIIAVVLGLLAVFAVSRMIRPHDAEDARQTVDVVAATKQIAPDDGEIKKSWLTKRTVDLESIPAKAIPFEQANRIVGQKVLRTVAQGDYILLSDMAGTGDASRLSNTVGDGEWAVPVTFSDSALVEFLQPGDEIAILGTFMMKEVKRHKDQSEKPDILEQRATSVLFPCVRILDIGRGDGVRRVEGLGNGMVVVALKPQQAMTLVAAQRTMELYPALRRANDPTASKRKDVGVVNDMTFQNIKEGLEPISIPDESVKR